MDNEKANRFVASLVKSIQALCNGYIDFSSSIEVVGHIHLNIDRNVKLNYVLTEEVSKSETEGSTVFASHSYHSQHPSSLSSKAKKSDNFSHHSRQKSQQSDEIDPLNFTSIPPEVHNISNSDLSRGQSTVCLTESGNHGDNVLSVKLENSSSSSQKHESLDRRRKNLEFERTASPPAAKRHRNSSRPKPAEENFEVIEIKEEPDDDLSVSFGDADAHMAVGQDLHTPDFSNVVMESLDRVGKVEGSQLVGGSEDLQMHHQKAPFPVMMHASGTVPSTSVSSIMDPVPGLSSEHQAVASTDEVGLSHTGRDFVTYDYMSNLGPPPEHLQGSTQQQEGYSDVPFQPNLHFHRHKRNPQSDYWRYMSEEKRAIEREKSRLRMQISRARRRERERLLAERKKT